MKSGRGVMFKIPTPLSLLSRLLVNGVILLAFIYPVAHLNLFARGNVEPYRRGFFCDDESLKHPFVEETLSVEGCVLLWAIAVPIIIFAVEGALFSVYQYPDRDHSLVTQTRTKKGNLILKIPYVAIEVGRILGYFFMGTLATLLTTEMAKYKVGRLRPYFLTLCNLQLTKELCEDQDGYQKFVTAYTCQADAVDIREARKSFLSGHSSLSFFCATFLVVYLQARLGSRHPSQRAKKPSRRLPVLVMEFLKTIRPFIQFSIFMVALYISISRISDYKHHPMDVVVGIAVGLVFALITLLILADLFRRPLAFYSETSEDDDLVVEVADSESGWGFAMNKDVADCSESSLEDPTPLMAGQTNLQSHCQKVRASLKDLPTASRSAMQKP